MTIIITYENLKPIHFINFTDAETNLVSIIKNFYNAHKDARGKFLVFENNLNNKISEFSI
jgi:hypothetical protein